MASFISRRTFMAGSSLMLGGGRVASQEARFLVAEPTTSRFFGDGTPTQHWHFRGTGPLPVVRAGQGEETTLHFINNLEEDIWLHLYGLRVDPSAVTVLLPKGPGGSIDLTFTPPDAGTFWIGPLLNASKQREMGLYAMLIVEEKDSLFADVPVLLDDWKVAEDGVLDRKFSDIAIAAGEGRLGNWVTVNGVAKPVIALSSEKPSRLRLLNACNARTLNIQLKGADSSLIALDGQPVRPEPLPAAGLSLAPGQRADIVPMRANDDMALILDQGADTLEAAFFSRATALPATPAGFALAANPLPVLLAGAPESTIPIVIAGGIKGGLKAATAGSETLELRALLERGLAWAINGKAGLQQTPLFEAQFNETIILAFDNQTSFAQPIAIDGHVWHQLTQNSGDVGIPFWRDTAIIPPKSKASYIFTAANPGLWTLSSLVAERSDAGLIGSFRINPGP